jgi:ABC-type cobalamin/Fe3+-siderophores transport system ATPase subunit
MLKRLYADNYKCLVNFELPLGPFQLLLGQNGTGKSTVRKVLSSLQKIVNGSLVTSEFETSTLTRWQARSKQSFSLDVQRDDALYRYELLLEHDRSKKRCHIERESVTFDSKPLYLFENGDVQLYNDRFDKGPTFPFNWSRSFLPNIIDRHDNQLLIWFRSWLNGVHCIQIDPMHMGALSEAEDIRPTEDLTNFASWYRLLLPEYPGKIMDFYKSLGEIIEGFDSLALVQYGKDVKMLQMNTKVDGIGKAMEYAFDELSDGQRAIVALYALLHYAIGPGTTLFLDEPDNYVALREIQPWLMSILDACDELKAQVILVSHHPEVINYLAPENAMNFVRDGGAHTRVQPFPADSGLTSAELVARGWESG